MPGVYGVRGNFRRILVDDGIVGHLLCFPWDGSSHYHREFPLHFAKIDVIAVRQKYATGSYEGSPISRTRQNPR